MKDLENRNCLVCDRIGLIIKGKNKYFVKELVSGYVVLCDFQFYFGYTLFLSKTHVNELHKLSKRERYIFLKEMAKVAEAVYKTFKPKKLNYGLMGNTDTHIHWHLIPRYENDLQPETAIWAVDKKIRCNKMSRPKEDQLKKMKERLLVELNKL